MGEHIDVIATTISGSIKDWGKVKQIVPLFKEYGINDVTLCAVDSHRDARIKTKELIQKGVTGKQKQIGQHTFQMQYDRVVFYKGFKTCKIPFDY